MCSTVQYVLAQQPDCNHLDIPKADVYYCTILEILKQGLQYESYLIRTFRDIPIISNKKLERYKAYKYSRKCSKYTQI